MVKLDYDLIEFTIQTKQPIKCHNIPNNEYIYEEIGYIYKICLKYNKIINRKKCRKNYQN